MKFQTFLSKENKPRLGILVKNSLYDIHNTSRLCGIFIPDNIQEFLQESDTNLEKAKRLLEFIDNNHSSLTPVQPLQILSPIPNPPSVRDGYAFRQHVAAARRNRGLDMLPEFDEYPIFYFTNHHSIIGEGDVLVELDHLAQCDFELEWAAVIGKQGKNIDSKDADSYIFGFTIMNDFSARTLQMEEMKLNLGPAKGKDFATSLGPFIITPDELIDYKITTEFGNNYNLPMTAKHNGVLISDGNTKDMNWTFAEIIERASYGVTLYPGDVIGSGTVGTGCYLELNGTRAREAKEQGEIYSPVWLQNGDEIELEIEMLGKLTNKIKLSENNISILSKKKHLEM
ncbi:MAG: putative catechol pathway protein [Ignavibacteria bacterium]|nr:putative catechol pathway protein [Ignavibacteria bacterium]